MKRKKGLIIAVICFAILLMAIPAIISGIKLHARTPVYLKNGDVYDISTAGKNTIVFINDDTGTVSMTQGTGPQSPLVTDRPVPESSAPSPCLLIALAKYLP